MTGLADAAPMQHLMLAPVLLPLLVAALMLLLGEERHRLKMALNVGSCAVLLGVSCLLLLRAANEGAPQAVGVYLPGNWQAPFGIVLALDRLSALMLVLTAVLALATPAFWIGILVITWPSVWWGWSPPIHYVDFWEDPVANLNHVWIPASILGLHITGGFIRFTRTAVLEVMRQDYVRTARAKGLGTRLVVIRHVMRNAAIPIVTLVGLQAPILLGGVVIVETIFTIPGMGRYLLTALENRDYQVLQAVVMILVTFVLLINLLVDLVYSLLDPRIKFG